MSVLISPCCGYEVRAEKIYLNPAYSKASSNYLRYGVLPSYKIPQYLCQVEISELQEVERFYIWRTQQDHRVRIKHAALHGHVFSWSDPSANPAYAPGHEKNCRCWGEHINDQNLEKFINHKDITTWPKPPIDGKLEEGLPTRDKPRNKGEKSLYDQYGGQWRPHIDMRHNLHWDYQAPRKGADWLNIPINGRPTKKIVLKSFTNMLQIKYFKAFKDNSPKLVISGDSQSYLKAGEILANQKDAYFDDPRFAIYYPSKYITKKELYLDPQECKKFAEIFLNFAQVNGCHDYFDTKALGYPDPEVFVSCNEYTAELFDEDEDD